MKQFSDLGLTENVLQAVTSEGYTNPTPIQTKAIPAMIAGSDIVGIAQTGTGKTAAFVLPLLHHIETEKVRPQPKRCNTLILAPTRELAAQIADSVRAYGKNVRLSCSVIVGGVRPGPQIKAMARGVDIIVATPGRLEDHMSTGAIRLDDTTTVILDEADQMMDIGFLPAIRRILAKTPKQRQTHLFTATMPKQIRRLANDFLNSPLEISVAPQSQPIERINQKVFLVDQGSKRDLLINTLNGEEVERGIVFTRTKRGADKVSQHLQKAGLTAAAIHGNKSQSQRQRTLGAFRSGNLKFLVATDIAARGIDIDDVSHVVNYELPNVPEVYVHRIGRTARAGKSGYSVSFCDGSERGLLKDIEKLIGKSIVKENLAANDSSADANSETTQKKKPSRPRNRNHKRSGPGGHKSGPKGQNNRPRRRNKQRAA